MQHLHVNAVVTRDGFQNEPAFVPADARLAPIDTLSACGDAKIEVTSFTSAGAIPMLRETSVAGLISDLHPASAHIAALRGHRP